ncbi:hypothetical protein C5O19_00935 [Siphonobacter curvatus]|uniref:Ig-like domain-containing protein n=2 Tax=Siphonobacter curvatus TaxID=2094562 RepID=A0A2S7IKS6_9BACT|nr:hypothetical protein C5O19_00935 [Siphonobacter curvatus]
MNLTSTRMKNFVLSLFLLTSALMSWGRNPTGSFFQNPVCPLKVAITPTSVGLCASGSVVLTANPSGTASSGAVTYQWRRGTQIVGTSRTYTATTVGIYSVTLSQGSCRATDTLTITLNPTPDLSSIAGDSALCEGQKGNLSVTTSGSTSPYTYQWKLGSTVLADKTPQLSITKAGTYTVTVTDAKGCTASTTKTVQETKPVLYITTATSKLNLCSADQEGVKMQIFRTENFTPDTYAWRRGTTVVGTGSTFEAKDAGTYTLQATAKNGCQAVSGNSIPIQKYNSPTAYAGADTSLTGKDRFEPKGIIPASGGTSPYTYAWQTSANTPVYTVANPSIGPFKGSAQVWLTVTDRNGCTARDTARITYIACKLKLSVTGADYLCEGRSSTQWTGRVTDSLGAVTYSWRQGSSLVFGNRVNLTKEGTYLIKVEDARGCEDSLSRSITIKPTPTVQISGDLFYCRGGGALLRANPAGGQAPYAYEWKLGTAVVANASGVQFNASAPGNYTVTVRDSLGCRRESAAVSIVERGQNIVANIVPAGKTTTMVPDSVVLNAVTGANYAYQWRKDNAEIAGATRPRLVLRGSQATGNYVVVVISEGCSVPSSPVNVWIEGPTAVEPGTTEVAVKVYPNPSASRAIIEINLPQAAAAQLQVYTLAGQPVLRQQDTQVQHQHRFDLDLSGVTGGMLLWKVQAGAYVREGKLIKTN